MSPKTVGEHDDHIRRGGIMNVEEITVETADDRTTVTAHVSLPDRPGVLDLWIDIPAAYAGTGASTAADPWLAALLLPAMRRRGDLRIGAPLSTESRSALSQIQEIYSHWLPSARPISLVADGELAGEVRADGVGLFFSCGVDSWYSLLRSQDRELVGRSSPITHLVHVHGVDIDVDEWKADIAGAVADNTRRIAADAGIEALSVSTNLRRFYSSTGLSWHWGQAGALAAVALLLQDHFQRFVVAAGAITSSVATHPDREAGGCHPLLIPLFSTPRCELVVDGGEVDRVGKVERVARSRLALETLRVCWASHEPGYNCGRCAKCVRTMLELTAVGALGRCRTLPAELDPDDLARVATLFPHEVPILQDRHDRLVEIGADTAALDALKAGITRSGRIADQVDRALRTIRDVVPEDTPIALFDEDEIHFDLARTHAFVVPFPECEGFYNGLPSDDGAAVTELHRLRDTGVTHLAVWKNAFWAIDHYAALRDLLESRCRVVARTDEVVVHELWSDEP